MRKKVIWIGLLGILGYGVIPSIWVRMKRLIFKKTNGHTLYLTFDDGPDHFYTPQL
ncbi:polysaccharide deacetylase family protein, partial [Turicibacter sanguinis]|nr:polysaccharide deacetylase family protein [Turicibacter sanguinis]